MKKGISFSRSSKIILVLFTFFVFIARANAAGLTTYRIPIEYATNFSKIDMTSSNTYNDYPAQNFYSTRIEKYLGSYIGPYDRRAQSKTYIDNGYSVQNHFTNDSRHAFSAFRIDLSNSENHYIFSDKNDQYSFANILNTNIKSAVLKLKVNDFAERNTQTITHYEAWPSTTERNELSPYKPNQELYSTANDSWYGPYFGTNPYFNLEVTRGTGEKEHYTQGSDFNFPDFTDKQLLQSSRYNNQSQGGQEVWDISDKLSNLIQSNSDGVLSFILQNSPIAYNNFNAENMHAIQYDAENQIWYDIYSPYYDLNDGTGSYFEIQVEDAVDGGNSDAPVPEPSSLVLGVMGLAGLIGIKRKK